MTSPMTSPPLTLARVALALALAFACGRAAAEEPPRAPPQGATEFLIFGRSSLRDGGVSGALDADPVDADSEAPPVVPTGHDLIQVAALGEVCYALRTSGQIERWDAFERLPLSTDEMAGAGGVFVNSRFRSLVASRHGVCATKRSGLHVCWGDLWFDAFGTETQWPAQVVVVSSDGLLGLADDGAIQCLGDESFCDVKYPERVRDVTCGDGGYCCALDASGRARCWSHEGSALSVTPRQALSQVSVDSGRACGVRADGRLLCWHLSDYAEDVLYTPAGDDFVRVVLAQGSAEACALRRGGGLVCWEADAQVIEAAGGVAQVALGYESRCLLHTDGSVSSAFDVEPTYIDDDLAAISAPLLPLRREYGLGGLAGLFAQEDEAPNIAEVMHLGDASAFAREGVKDMQDADEDVARWNDLPEGVQVEGAPVSWAIRVANSNNKASAWVGFDPLTGLARWTVKAPSADDILCALQSGDTALVISLSEAVAVDAKTGAKRWAWTNINGDPLCRHVLSPGHDAGFLALIDDPEALAEAFGEDTDVSYALALIDPKTGRARWHHPFSEALKNAQQDLEYQKLWADSAGVIALPSRGTDEPPHLSALRAFAAADGALAWLIEPPQDHALVTFTVTGDIVWVVSVEIDPMGDAPDVGLHRYHLRPFNRSDGAPHPTALPSVMDAPPGGTLWLLATPSELIAVTSADGFTRVIDAASGEHRWSWGLGEGLASVQALTSTRGAWLVARTDYGHALGSEGALLLPLDAPPTQAPVTVSGTLPEHWGPMVIGGQRVKPFPIGQFSVELSAGGLLTAYAAFNDCAAPAAGEVRQAFTVTPTTGHLWLPLVWSEVMLKCP
jgi:outer membrane protein assembly factor BamB